MTEKYSLPRLTLESSSEYFANLNKYAPLSSPILSSDPIFSSDDEPSCENYVNGRQKRKFRGPWFCQRPALDEDLDRPRKARRQLERQFDSGVFMNDDTTDLDLILEPTDSPTIPVQWQVSRHPPTPDELALQQILLCLEEGNETVDLSSRGLSQISNEMIKPLSTFTRMPSVTEGVFSVLEPSLKIFLASNELTTLPSELFNLDHLHVLSLRGNLIEELPPKIGALSNLRELNLSQNGLRYLPFEILTLLSEKGSLEILHLHPNLFYQPEFPALDKPEKDLDTEDSSISRPRSRPRSRRGAICRVSKYSGPETPSNRWQLKYQASSEVRFLDTNGSLVEGPHFASPGLQGNPLRLLTAKNDYQPKPPSHRGNCLSRAPSLLETALATCFKSPQLPYLAPYLPEDSPSNFHELLNLAVLKKETGCTSCTVCGRNFIIPRTEWIEWWEISKAENFDSSATQNQTQNNRDDLERLIPLMRRGCSWLCIPHIP
ncbi:hypothetical protein K3495_g6021 [Podosphaera aphanis]|nr:hypothetical protein K3495_g6021 [Podosphaera aphanis]